MTWQNREILNCFKKNLLKASNHTIVLLFYSQYAQDTWIINIVGNPILYTGGSKDMYQKDDCSPQKGVGY